MDGIMAIPVIILALALVALIGGSVKIVHYGAAGRPIPRPLRVW